MPRTNPDSKVAYFLSLPKGESYIFDLAGKPKGFKNNLYVAAKRKDIKITTEEIKGWNQFEPVKLLKATIAK